LHLSSAEKAAAVRLLTYAAVRSGEEETAPAVTCRPAPEKIEVAILKETAKAA